MYSPREMQLPFGRSATLDCHFRANPPLTSLRWEKDGFLFDPYNVQGVFYRRNGSLFFSKVGYSGPRGPRSFLSSKKEEKFWRPAGID